MLMNNAQNKIVEISKIYNIEDLSLRKLGQLIGISHPQTVKYYLEQVKVKGLIRKRPIFNEIKSYNDTIDLPILGEANCGLPTLIANKAEVDYLKISRNILKKKKNIFAVRTIGDSMNKFKIDGKTLESGDFAIVDSNDKSPKDGSCIVSIIDGCACIKKFYFDHQNHRIALISQSTKVYAPIFIDIIDLDKLTICGRVIQIIKDFKKYN